MYLFDILFNFNKTVCYKKCICLPNYLGSKNLVVFFYNFK